MTTPYWLINLQDKIIGEKHWTSDRNARQIAYDFNTAEKKKNRKKEKKYHNPGTD